MNDNENWKNKCIFLSALWSIVIASLMSGAHSILILMYYLSDVDAYEFFSYQYMIDYITSSLGVIMISLNIVFAILPFALLRLMR